VFPLSDTVIVGLLALIGTLAGTFGGILTANKLTTYRIERLEEKVNQHNNLIERTFKLEGRMNEAEHDIKDLKGYHKPGQN
jgi:hypothetical protein